MNFFGIGGWELAFFFIIALVVAGPKRMIQWAYILGTYVAKFRAVWAETMKLIQKEFDAAGLDVQVPKELPTSRAAMRQQVNKAFKPITKPIEDTVKKPIEDTVKEVNSSLQIPAKSNGTNGTPPEGTTSQDDSSFGTWSGTGKTEN
jgi:Sec-independent protein translocase protein TatA